MTVIQPYDLVELAEAIEAYSKPHVGSAWGKAIAEDYGLPMTTPRQEEIIKWWYTQKGKNDGD